MPGSEAIAGKAKQSSLKTSEEVPRIKPWTISYMIVIGKKEGV